MADVAYVCFMADNKMKDACTRECDLRLEAHRSRRLCQRNASGRSIDPISDKSTRAPNMSIVKSDNESTHQPVPTARSNMFRAEFKKLSNTPISIPTNSKLSSNGPKVIVKGVLVSRNVVTVGREAGRKFQIVRVRVVPTEVQGRSAPSLINIADGMDFLLPSCRIHSSSDASDDAPETKNKGTKRTLDGTSTDTKAINTLSVGFFVKDPAGKTKEELSEDCLYIGCPVELQGVRCEVGSDGKLYFECSGITALMTNVPFRVREKCAINYLSQATNMQRSAQIMATTMNGFVDEWWPSTMSAPSPETMEQADAFKKTWEDGINKATKLLQAKTDVSDAEKDILMHHANRLAAFDPTMTPHGNLPFKVAPHGDEQRPIFSATLVFKDRHPSNGVPNELMALYEADDESLAKLPERFVANEIIPKSIKKPEKSEKLITFCIRSYFVGAKTSFLARLENKQNPTLACSEASVAVKYMLSSLAQKIGCVDMYKCEAIGKELLLTANVAIVLPVGPKEANMPPEDSQFPDALFIDVAQGVPHTGAHVSVEFLTEHLGKGATLVRSTETKNKKILDDQASPIKLVENNWLSKHGFAPVSEMQVFDLVDEPTPEGLPNRKYYVLFEDLRLSVEKDPSITTHTDSGEKVVLAKSSDVHSFLLDKCVVYCIATP
jgi:hypothetical protein